MGPVPYYSSTSLPSSVGIYRVCTRGHKEVLVTLSEEKNEEFQKKRYSSTRKYLSEEVVNEKKTPRNTGVW